jgi:phosphoglycerate dehydrogenase-like enzyme
MINLDNYKILSNDCILINTSRAEVISYDAFKLILKEKKGISYDTFYKNKISNDNLKSELLKKNHNLIITPYIASINENKSFPVNDIILNLISYYKNNKLKNLINFKEGY